MSSGGGSPSTQTQRNEVILPQWLQNMAKNSITNAQFLSDTKQHPYEANPYTQDLAGATPDQQAAWASIRGSQGATNDEFDASKGVASGLLGQATPLTADQLNANTQALFNPYTTAVVDPTTQLMRQALGQSLGQSRANASNVGAFGGSRLGIQEGTAQAQESLQEGQLISGLLSSGWDKAAARGDTMASTNLNLGKWATELLPTLATSQQNVNQRDAALLENVGATQQGMTQAELDNDAANWQRQLDYPWQQQERFQAALTATPYGGTSFSTMQGATPKKNMAAGILGGAAAGASIGSVVPGYGTAIGAVAGGLLGAFS